MQTIFQEIRMLIVNKHPFVYANATRTIYCAMRQLSISSERKQNKTKDAPKVMNHQQTKYNHGLDGKGKSKRSKFADLPATQGEVLFGLHPVKLALTAGRRSVLHALYVDSNLLKRSETDSASVVSKMFGFETDRLPIHSVSKPVLDQLAGNRPHQGVCLDASELIVPDWSEDTQLCRYQDQMPLWLYLHNVQDPMNMGAIMRTAHFFGFHKIVVPHSNSCRLSPVVSKASAGSLEVIDIVRLPKRTSEIELCKWWQSRGWEVVGTAVKDPAGGDAQLIDLYNFTTRRPTMVVLGNEGSGLTQELMNVCDRLVTIPTHEHKYLSHSVGSLNVSVAAGILLHWIKTSSCRKR